MWCGGRLDLCATIERMATIRLPWRLSSTLTLVLLFRLVAAPILARDNAFLARPELKPCPGVIASAEAMPQTTDPGGVVSFTIVPKNTEPGAVVTIDFDDRTPFVHRGCLDGRPISVAHSFLATGVFNPLVTLESADCLASTTYVPVYVGTCICYPDARILAEPSRFNTDGVCEEVPNPMEDDLRLRISLRGRFLGRWRVRIFSPKWARQWVYIPRSRSLALSPCIGKDLVVNIDSVWANATSNNFTVPICSGILRSQQAKDTDLLDWCLLPSGTPTKNLVPDVEPPDYWSATLEYRDAFDMPITTWCHLPASPLVSPGR